MMNKYSRLLLSILTIAYPSSISPAISQQIPSSHPPILVQVGPDVVLPADAFKLSLYEKATHKVKFGTVVCGPQSAVYVVNTAHCSAIFVLDLKQKDDVQILIGGTIIETKPGDEILVSNEANANFERLNPHIGIPFRGQKLRQSLGDIKIFGAQFSLAKACEQIPQICKLVDSTDPEKQKTLNRLLKNAAKQS